jgi:hypothetical protein
VYYGKPGWLSLAFPGHENVHAILAAPPMECVVCKVDDREKRLGKCPICFKPVCENCSTRTMGRDFCSKRCADQFFFGDDDE